jgi:GDP-D-mannose dehydratase
VKKIGIIGTRGIPNQYGGFEQFAQFFSEHLVQKGYEVVVYCSSNHTFQEKTWKGVSLVHIKDPEKSIGTVGQFIYDLRAILHARKQKFDVIFQLGYTSSSIWGFLFPKKAKLITNMDGLEWKRTN